MKPTEHVLISNDDGIDAHGLRVLEETAAAPCAASASPWWRPTTSRAPRSHSLTLTSPLRIIEQGEDRYAVTGTPTDSVLVAMEKILRDDPPDIVL